MSEPVSGSRRIKELDERLIDRAVALAGSELIEVDDLPPGAGVTMRSR